MRVICTGISGTERVGFLDDVVRAAEAIGRPLPIFDVREAMFQIARDIGEPVEEETILDMFPPALVLLRAAALEKISGLCEQAEQHQDWIINTHAVFRWRNNLISGFDPYYLGRLMPDLYVTVTAGVQTVRERLRRYSRWEDTSEEDLLVWREEEQWATEEMARIHHKPQYLLGRGSSPSSLFRLMFDPQVQTAYLSYPMQHVDLSTQRHLGDFKRRLERRLVVFDPADVNDFEVEAIGGESASDGTSELAPARAERTLSERVVKHISDQIVFRDYKMIAQADVVVVYYDALVPSPGVISEMNYALQTGKRVYGVWLPDSEPSPFFTRYLTRCFRDVDDLFAHFERHGVGSPNETVNR